MILIFSKRHKVIFLILVLVSTVTNAGEEVIPATVKDYAASMITYNERNERERKQVHVVFTRDGVRLSGKDVLGAGKAGVFIQNFSSKQSWLLNPELNQFVNLTVEEQESEPLEPSEQRGNAIMSTSVCIDNDDDKREKVVSKKLIETYNNADQVHTRWECRYNQEKVIQVFNEYFGIVVKERTANLDVAELVAIQEVTFSSDYFLPPASYSEVSLEEFYTGRKALLPYSEAN